MISLNRFFGSDVMLTFIFQHAEEVKLADERKLIDEVMQEQGCEHSILIQGIMGQIAECSPDLP